MRNSCLTFSHDKILMGFNKGLDDRPDTDCLPKGFWYDWPQYVIKNGESYRFFKSYYWLVQIIPFKLIVQSTFRKLLFLSFKYYMSCTTRIHSEAFTVSRIRELHVPSCQIKFVSVFWRFLPCLSRKKNVLKNWKTINWSFHTHLWMVCG